MAYRFISRDIVRSHLVGDAGGTCVSPREVEANDTYEVVFDAALASSTSIVTAIVIGGGIVGWACGIGAYALARKRFQQQ